MKRSILIIFVVLLVLPLLIGYMHYRSSKVEQAGLDEFVGNLNKAVQHYESFRMTDVAAFEWDRMFMFPPYTTRDEMEQIAGSKWTTSASFLGYLFQRSDLGKYPLDDDSLHKLVFVNDGRIVLDVTLDRSIDFTSIGRITERYASVFAVEKVSNRRVVIHPQT